MKSVIIKSCLIMLLLIYIRCDEPALLVHLNPPEENPKDTVSKNFYQYLRCY